MPPLSSQQKIQAPFLSVPKKPASFADPLTRPEIGSGVPVKEIVSISSFSKNSEKTIASKTEPLIPPLRSKSENPPAKIEKMTAPTLRTGTNVPTIQKEISTPITVPPKETLSAPAKTLPVLPWKNQPTPKAPSQSPKTPASVFHAPETPRRKLPDEIKDIFEANSKNFADYAKNGKKDSIAPDVKTETSKQVMDEWDRALFLGEYSPMQISHRKIEKLLSLSVSSPIPKKADAFVAPAAFPGRVIETPVITTHKNAPKPVIKLAAEKPGESAAPLPKAGAIPQKPKSSDPTPTAGVSSTTALQIPKKPMVQSPKVSSEPSPNISDKLVEKIIEGQMRSVFENAPPLIQKSFEKMTIKEIETGSAPAGNIENDVWKKRVREYVKKLRVQAHSAFPGSSTMDPLEDELFLNYIGRIYPSILKAELAQQEKSSM